MRSGDLHGLLWDFVCKIGSLVLIAYPCLFISGSSAYSATVTIPARTQPRHPMNPLSERLRLAIEDEIATGRRLPGAHLDETELAQRFGVSRTPIRETLSLLAGIGLIEARPRRGAVVAQSWRSRGAVLAAEHGRVV